METHPNTCLRGRRARGELGGSAAACKRWQGSAPDHAKKHKIKRNSFTLGKSDYNPSNSHIPFEICPSSYRPCHSHSHPLCISVSKAHSPKPAVDSFVAYRPCHSPGGTSGTRSPPTRSESRRPRKTASRHGPPDCTLSCARRECRSGSREMRRLRPRQRSGRPCTAAGWSCATGTGQGGKAAMQRACKGTYKIRARTQVATQVAHRHPSHDNEGRNVALHGICRDDCRYRIAIKANK